MYTNSSIIVYISLVVVLRQMSVELIADLINLPVTPESALKGLASERISH